MCRLPFSALLFGSAPTLFFFRQASITAGILDADIIMTGAHTCDPVIAIDAGDQTGNVLIVPT
jgi:hypothetical protein